MFKSCLSGSQSFIKFGFDTSVETDNTIYEISNIIGAGSIYFLCDHFFIRFFTRNSTFFLKDVLAFWKSICNYFWWFWLLVSRMMIYGINTNYRGILMIMVIVLSFSVVSQFNNPKRFGEYILSAALFKFLSKKDFIIFLFSLNLVSDCLASWTFRHISWNITPFS